MYKKFLILFSIFIGSNLIAQKADLSGSFDMKIVSSYHSLNPPAKKIKNKVSLSFMNEDLNPVNNLPEGKIEVYSDISAKYN